MSKAQFKLCLCFSKFSGLLFLFSRFPKDPIRLEAWTLALKTQNFRPTKYTLICDDHFSDQDKDKTGQTVRLKPTAIPTKFNFPDHLQKKLISRKPPLVRQIDANSQVPSNRTSVTETDSTAVNTERESSEVTTEHNYCVVSSPNTLKRKLTATTEALDTVKKRLKLSQQTSRRLKKKVENLDAVVSELQNGGMISEQCAEMLDSTFSGVPLEMMKRLLKNKDGKTSREEYNKVLKSFALTLQFYSSKAYNYVRETFELALPHESTIRKWYSSIDVEPGFSEIVFQALEKNSWLKKSKVKTLYVP